MLYNLGSTSYIILAYPLTYLIFRLISAKQMLASYTLPNIYAALYSSQLVYLFMTAINFRYILSVGL